ncbi:MAG: EamA family transporter [Candidatus Bathyarchaeia archaeon]
MDLKPILLTALCAFIGSIGQLEFKRGSENLQFTFHALITNYHLIAGILLYAFSTLIYVYALSLGKLSILYPIIATSYIWATLLAKVFLHETINMTNWIGLALILLGVTLIAWQK